MFNTGAPGFHRRQLGSGDSLAHHQLGKAVTIGITGFNRADNFATTQNRYVVANRQDLVQLVGNEDD